MAKKKFGLIALVGEPNVGKSTLINAMVDHKISIVTHKVQTTRFNIRGVCNYQNSQMVFIDTPGIFDAKRSLEKAIVHNAFSGIDEADIICFIFDIRNLEPKILNRVMKRIEGLNKKCYAIINKCDFYPKNRALPKLEEVYNTGLFEEVFLTSALKKRGLEHLKDFLAKKLNDGEWMFAEDELTDTPSSTIAEEITREQAYILLHEELPYSLKVETDLWKEADDGILEIHQTIYVMKESQKSIVLGNGGEKIKQIGQRARLNLQTFLNRKLRLFLFVKVREDWIERDFNKTN